MRDFGVYGLYVKGDKGSVVGKCGDRVEFVKKMCGVFDVRWQFGDQGV